MYPTFLSRSVKHRLTLLALCAATTFASFAPASAQQSPLKIAPPEVPIQFEGELSAQLVETSSLIRAQQARSTYNVDGSGLTVAVLDTGLRTTHQDFAGRVATQVNYTSDNGGDSNNANDGQGHGTNVGGIIVANGIHVGIAPGAKIIPLKVLSNTGSGNFAATKSALEWVYNNRATYNISVVNMSLGANTNTQTNVYGDSDGVQTAIDNLRSVGVAVVIAAGNSFYDFESKEGMAFPAIIKSSVSVGAVYDDNIGSVEYGNGAAAYTTAADRITPFSQRLSDSVGGEFRTDIFAPGAALTSSGIDSDTGSSIMHGTSQATPVTAGVILLMQQHYKKLTGKLPSVDLIEAALRSSAVSINDGDDEDDNVTNTDKNFPRVDALNAIQAITPPNNAPKAEHLHYYTLQNQDVTIDLQGTDSDGDALTYSITAPPRAGLLIPVSNTRYIYRPKPYMTGTVGFFYKANDGKVDSNTAAVKISIKANSSLLIAQSQKIVVPRNTQVTVTLISTGGGPNITYSIVAPPRRGALEKLSNSQYRFKTPNDNCSVAFSFNATDGTQVSSTGYVSFSVQ